MKKKKSLSITLALALCAGLLAGCSTSTSDTSESPSAAAEETVSPSASSAEETSTAYQAGKVLALDGSEATVQLYASASDGATEFTGDAAGFDLSSCTLSAETAALSLDGTDLLYYLDSETGEMTAAALEDVAPGSVLLFAYDADTGALSQVIVQSYGEDRTDRLAQVAALTEDSLDLTWYQSADETAASVLNYTGIDLTSYTLGDTTESFALTDTVSLYQLQDGVLVESTSADLAQGGDVIASVTSDGQLTQLILLPSASDAPDAADPSAAPDSGADT